MFKGPRPHRPQDLAVEQLNQPSPHRLLHTKDVIRKLKKFNHFLYVWGTKGGFYLPPRSALTWHYVSQVLGGEKSLLRVEDVGRLQELPKAKGLQVNLL